jgi:ArsR family transcriptional regulator, arsenate/arsenite/antimonite-responsive transcriptional repressor
MSIRLKIAGCCEVPQAPAPLTEAERERMVAAFRALGDPTRLEIFRLLAAQAEPVCACDVVDRFGLSQPTISHHLRTLREAGLVKVSRRGVWAWYELDPQGLVWLRETLSTLAGSPESSDGEEADQLVAAG